MKIIVTGGAGFIASHIADAYIKAGHNVVVIDNLSTGFRKNINPKAKLYKADIRNLTLVEKIFKKEKPEILNHHAARISVVESVRDPAPTLQTNVLGMANVLLAFGKYGRGRGKKALFASSGGAIYGEPKNIPANEKTPTNPLSPYGLSKLLGEELVKFYAREYKFPYFIFRYPNIYGPRQNPKGEAGIVAIFGRLIKQGVRPTIFGDGTKSRDYVYVGDIVRANILALSRGKNEIANLGWGRTVSDQLMFDAIAEAVGFRKRPIYAHYREGEVYRIALDISRAKKVLGWQPKMDLLEGVKRTVATL